MKRHHCWTIGGAILALFASGAHAQDAVVDLGTIAVGDARFWDDGRLDGTGVYSLPSAPSLLADSLCEAEQPCFQFTLEVGEYESAVYPDARLRLAYDTPMRDDNFRLTVTDPLGNSTARTNGNQYTLEAFFDDPAPGTWTIELVPYSAEEAPFRLRAKLEAAPFRPADQPKYTEPGHPDYDPEWDGTLLPNLRVIRMWEFTWAAPVNPLNGLFPPDDLNPPLSVAGVEPVSCAADETAGFDGEPATRCLRYSFGLANVGDGVFDIRWAGDRTTVESHSMVQCLETVFGDPIAHREAGDGGFHQTHGHWHYQDVVFHELFTVDHSTSPPTVESTGNGKKIGYSPADQVMPDWHDFVQASSGTSGAQGNCAPETNNRLGMSQGWGDAYRYQRPGNFVEFGMNGDGEYVVQTTADPLDHVLETDDGDNTAYAHLRITGDEIEILETGLGQHPWDPSKTVWVDWWTQ